MWNDDSIPDGLQPADLDGDGISDALIVTSDLDGNGIDETVTVFSDTDADGILDTVVTLSDANENGMIDSVDVLENTGNGFEHTYSARSVDTDGDLIGDTVVEVSGSGEYVAEMSEAEFSGQILGVGETDGFGENVSYSEGAGYEQFDPDKTDMSKVVGDPVGDEAQWEYQADDGPCAIYAQAMAYQNVTGSEIDIEELVEAAEEQGWYNGSTTIENMDKMLNFLGIEADVEYRGDFQDLDDVLSNGGRVVAAVDADEIWFGDNDSYSDYCPNTPNHAVEVIGIDYSGEEPMVILNDSGVPDGHAIMVSKERFMDAWEDSDYACVKVYA